MEPFARRLHAVRVFAAHEVRQDVLDRLEDIPGLKIADVSAEHPLLLDANNTSLQTAIA
jgi:hypothetical protein